MVGYFGRVKSWFSEYKLVILTLSFLAIILGVLIFDYRSDTTIFDEKVTRRTGLFLQIFGFITIAYGLHQTQILFDEQFKLLKAIKNFPLPWQHKSYTAFAKEGIVATLGGKAKVLALTAGNTLEERIVNLERKLENAQDDILDLTNQTAKQILDNRTQLDKLNNKIQTLKLDLDKFLDQALIDGIHWEWLGVAFFIVGVTFATIPQEISCVLNCQ